LAFTRNRRQGGFWQPAGLPELSYFALSAVDLAELG